MKRLTVILIGLSLLLLSCKEENPGNAFCPDGECTYTLFNESGINLVNSPDAGVQATVVPGDFRVFQYEYHYNDNPGIADDEFNDILLFQLDPDLTEFTLTGKSELESASVVFKRLCYCFAVQFYNATDGTITGKKISDGVWRISINVEIETPYDFSYFVKTEGIFTQ